MQFVSEGGSLGRYGQDLGSLIWPPDRDPTASREKRYVAIETFTPFSGEPLISVPKLEVHFALADHFLAETWAKKCAIVMATQHLQKVRLSRRAFFERVLKLYEKELGSGTTRSIHSLQ